MKRQILLPILKNLKFRERILMKGIVTTEMLKCKRLNGRSLSCIGNYSTLGNVFTVTRSYRAEKAVTRRHLTEYIHVEAEVPFIDFEDLLKILEDFLVGVCELIMEKIGDDILAINKDFKVPRRPIKRMRHSEAITWLREQNYRKPNGKLYEIGDDIPEAAERYLIDAVGEPLFLTHMPTALKWLYVQVDEFDSSISQTVDVLVPGVGEIIGGSIRIDDEKQLIDSYEKQGIDSNPYYWYIEQRVYGSCPHGGYGLGFERFVSWLLKKYHIHDVCLYPRFHGRNNP